MKKRKIILGLLILLICYVLHWTLEPFNLNPFSDKPISLSKSINELNCNNSYSHKSDSIINSAINKNNFLGVSLGIYSKNYGTWASTAGFINKKRQKKPNEFSKFRIASISKSMTAIAILQLYEKGLINLDVPIQTYLPEFPKKEKGKITIRQLLNHKSGISHYKSKFESIHFRHYKNSIDALNRFKNRELDYKPNSIFLYSSYGYTLLGAIIEKVSGFSYQEYMLNNIWKPSNMKNTDIENINDYYENKSNLYIKIKNTFYKCPQNDLSYTYSGGGIQSTAKDMLNFGKAILNYKLISPKTTELIINSINKNEKKYTYGWDNSIHEKYGQIIEHNGKQIGCSSFLRIFFDKKIVVVTLANNMNSKEEVRDISIKLSELLLNIENK